MGIDRELEPQRDESRWWRGRWLYPAASVLLGVAWWGAFWLHPLRVFLMKQPFVTEGWSFAGFASLVGIVTATSLLFRSARHRWPRWGWLSAPVCLWLGVVAFSLTVNADWQAATVLGYVLYAPVAFLFLAWPVALPMTALTALTLSALDRAQRRTALDRVIGR